MMQPINALALLAILYRKIAAAQPEGNIQYGTFLWFTYAGISCLLVLFAGICSGLTLALMPLSQVELEVLRRSGSPSEKKQAAAILPVVQKQHQLLVTLLLCNAAAMEALPLYLDKMFNPYLAIILSVTFVLFFGEVIPQAICARYGLAVGANFIWLVRIMVVICYPICYPIGKLLDWSLGHSEPLFRRDQLKAFVSIHGEEAGKGGELTHDETTIINGALDLTKKIAEEAMTPIESTFSLDVNSKLDWEAVGKIIASGHSRIPVYFGNMNNIIGVLLVKSLLTVRPETATPVSDVSIRTIPRVPADMPLYDILNEFQKGSSHMAAVVKSKGRKTRLPSSEAAIKNSDANPSLNTPLLSNRVEKPDCVAIDICTTVSTPTSRSNSTYNAAVSYGWNQPGDDTEESEVIGVITLEDVFEELLQEEIVDETDEFVDVHKRIRVMAAAAASSMARSPSFRWLTGQKGAGGQCKPGSSPRRSVEVGSPASRRSFGDTFSPNKKIRISNFMHFQEKIED
ncbi:CBS domain protein with a domain protein [Perilla frutescens var. frutescens]|nr:CBS domain protein with a domain protein [Perilla frutescens var. frutescens]